MKLKEFHLGNLGFSHRNHEKVWYNEQHVRREDMQIDTLQRKIDETQAVCRSLKQRSSSYAMQRGVLILIALLALFRGYYYEQLFYALCVLSLGLFLYIAAKHRR